MAGAKKGHILSESTKHKISLALKGRKFTPETLTKMSKSQMGRTAWNKGMRGVYTLSEEHKRKISNSCKGRKLSKEHIEKMRKASIGRKMSKEAREKMRQAKIGKYIGEKNPFWKDLNFPFCYHL